MRNGRRVYDADTHGGPCAELLEPYLDPSIRQRIPDLDTYKSPIKVGWAGEIREEPYKHYFRFGRGGGGWGHSAVRVLGEAGPREGMERHWQKFMGTKFPTEDGQWNAGARIESQRGWSSGGYGGAPSGGGGGGGGAFGGGGGRGGGGRGGGRR